MESHKRIALAFVERLLLNETGQDLDNWTHGHMEDVAKALVKIDQPGAASLLRARWARGQKARSGGHSSAKR